MSLITPDFGLLFWMTLIFLIVFFILLKFGFPAITGMVNERSERINASIAKAKEAEEKLATLAEQHKELIRQAELEQSRILKEASDAREAMIRKAREEAEASAAHIIEQAKARIAEEKDIAIREIRSEVTLLTVEVAEKVIRKRLEDRDEQQALISRYLDEADRLEKN
ncbi:MAG: F0F1 ATP synthase subunit B [Bacteroidales bacterium]|nr:F0F1 ATP synthase subunit B [Candidatus Cryptobacteroides equifaecalis]